MEIKTRYNIGQKIYYIPSQAHNLGFYDFFSFDNNIRSGKIEGVYITQDNKIYYRIDGCMLYEKDIYTSYSEEIKNKEGK